MKVGATSIACMLACPAPRKLARVRPLAAADVEAAETIHWRQHVQEGRGVQPIPIDVITGAGVPRPGLGVRLPIPRALGSVHGSRPAHESRQLATGSMRSAISAKIRLGNKGGLAASRCLTLGAARSRVPASIQV